MVTRGFLRMTVAARDVDLAPWLHETAPQEGRACAVRQPSGLTTHLPRVLTPQPWSAQRRS